MAISIDTNGNKRERELIESLAYYCIQKMMPRKKNLEIDIIQVTNLRNTDGDWANCIDTEDLNTFEIKVERQMSLRKKLLSVAHELVHVKQFARKELEHTESISYSTWYGKRYRTTNKYWELPWEIEAYGMELGLFNQWADDKNIKGKFINDPT
jgi:hypothetical protein